MRRAEPENSESLLASIVESAEDAIISLDASGRVITWNGGAERLYGFNAMEMLGGVWSIRLVVGPIR